MANHPQPAEKHAGGRPTKFSPAYCDELINAGADGYSLTAFAGMIGVHRDSLYEWAEKYPEFSDAIKRHRAKRTWKLETDLLKAESGPSVTSRIFALKNACPDEWREKISVGGDADNPLMVNHSFDLSNLSAEQLEAVAAAARALATKPD